MKSEVLLQSDFKYGWKKSNWISQILHNWN